MRAKPSPTGRLMPDASLDAIKSARVTELIGMLDVAFAASVVSLMAVAATDVSSPHFCEVLA